MSQKMLIVDGTCYLCKGHPSGIIFATTPSSVSALVKLCSLSSRSDNIGKLSSISSVELASCLKLCEPLDNASAIIKSLPGIYFTLNLIFLKSYQLRELSANVHFTMVSEGFLSDCVSLFLP